MKTYIFNTNFKYDDPEYAKLIAKQTQIMNQVDDRLVVVSNDGIFNYNRNLQIEKPHTKGLMYGMLVEDEEGKRLVDMYIPKTRGLFIATMFISSGCLVVADNGFNLEGDKFNSFVADWDRKDHHDLYALNEIYVIYVGGDVSDNILLDKVHATYIEDGDYTIITIGKIQPENVIKYTNGYKIGYSDNKFHSELLNRCNEAYAIGSDFDLTKLGEHVEHASKYILVNKYIELFIKE